MFIPKTRKIFKTFDLGDNRSVEEYNVYLNDPAFTVISVKYGKTEESTFEGDVSTTSKNDMLYVEFEECVF